MAINSSTPGTVPGAKPDEKDPAGAASPTGNLPGVPATSGAVKSQDEINADAVKPVDAVPASVSPEALAVLLEQSRLTTATALQTPPAFESLRVQPQETPLGQTIGQPGVGKEQKGSKAYQFPSAPTRFEFASTKRVAILPDGVMRTDDEDEIKELEAAVACGNIYPYTGDIISPFQKPAKPLDPNGPN